ncbi:MAG: polysaccharide pyruvyl transferase family protein [Paenirhodobacter sp.]
MAAQTKDHYDVGIVGVGIGANYGSVLTYYSLYKTIESLGKTVLMVSKIGASANDPEIQNTHAIRFARKHYNLSRIYSQQTVGELNQLADTFVIGSDQVWNYGISQHFGKAFYLDFADDGKRKISYAASFGHGKDLSPVDEVPKISALMKRFNAISVREDSGVRIARDVYHVPATQVAEPIFLTDVQHYRELAAQSSRDVSGPYLLAYILDPTPEKKAAIEHVAAKLGLRIRIILDAWPHLIKENKAKMNIEGAVEDDIDAYGFLKLYENCSYVVTDSFHGTAFALKFEKPFASIGNRRRGVVRFDSMFRLIGHRDRFTMQPEEIVTRDADFLAPLDYADIRAALDKHVRESKAWLQAALKKPVRDTIANSEAKALKPHWTARPELRRITKAAEKAARLVKFRIGRQHFRINAPAFTANNQAWKIETGQGVTRLRVAGPEFAGQRGNLVWTDLPSALREGTAYELVLEWTPRSISRLINVHLRNPETGRFKVVGSIETGGKRDKPRTDRISFTVTEAGFSQVMFGALHFGGPDGGADISWITLRSILPEAVVPNAAPVPASRLKKDAATAVERAEPGRRHPLHRCLCPAPRFAQHQECPVAADVLRPRLRKGVEPHECLPPRLRPGFDAPAGRRDEQVDRQGARPRGFFLPHRRRGHACLFRASSGLGCGCLAFLDAVRCPGPGPDHPGRRRLGRGAAGQSRARGRGRWPAPARLRGGGVFPAQRAGIHRRSGRGRGYPPRRDHRHAGALGLQPTAGAHPPVRGYRHDPGGAGSARGLSRLQASAETAAGDQRPLGLRGRGRAQPGLYRRRPVHDAAASGS